MNKENKKTLKGIYKVLKKASDKDIEKVFAAIARLAYEDERPKGR